ncbi:CCA tRNA nucleotidyltransferase [Candidatus Uhrbacteria bacterium]|nr:CCA tRNA nucleotidyltransferase [Candidatus Uhrbacteria bacterium]
MILPKEETKRILASNIQLAFVPDFLTDHGDAGLYLVGGAVRDILLQRAQTTKDFDFVVRGVSAEIIEAWFAKRGEINLVGKTFGVFKFMPQGLNPAQSSYIDIALPRREQSSAESQGGYKDFDVQTDATLAIEDDLSRRDFTINAMAIDLRTFDLIDPFGGVNDLEAHLIRTVGEAQIRFDEDLSRMLRAIHFAAQLGFTIEPATLEAITRNIARLHDRKDRGDFIVPRETIGEELAKAFFASPTLAEQWLKKAGALEILFGKTIDPDLLQKAPSSNPALAITLLLSSIPSQNVPPLLSQTGLDTLPHNSPLRIEPKQIVWAISSLQQFINSDVIKKLRASIFEKIFMAEHSPLLLNALRLKGNTTGVSIATQRIQAIRECWSVREDETIPPLLSGNDVLNAGVSAGPKVRETLGELRDEQLEGRILTREQAKNWLKKRA